MKIASCITFVCNHHNYCKKSFVCFFLPVVCFCVSVKHIHRSAYNLNKNLTLCFSHKMQYEAELLSSPATIKTT